MYIKNNNILLYLYILFIFFIVIVSNIKYKSIEKFEGGEDNINILSPFDSSLMALQNEIDAINFEPLRSSIVAFDNLMYEMNRNMDVIYNSLNNANKRLYGNLFRKIQSNLSLIFNNFNSFNTVPFINILNIYGKAIFEDIPGNINKIFDSIKNKVEENSSKIEDLQKQIDELKNR